MELSMNPALRPKAVISSVMEENMSSGVGGDDRVGVGLSGIHTLLDIKIWDILAGSGVC